MDEEFDYNATTPVMHVLTTFLGKYPDGMDRIHPLERRVMATALFIAARKLDSEIDKLASLSNEQIAAMMDDGLSRIFERAGIDLSESGDD